MVNATLYKLDANGNVVYTMTLPNMKLFNISLNFPVVATPLPQEDQSKQILLKLEGNSSAVKWSWTLKDESTSVVDEVAGITTIDKQVEFWRQYMRPVDITDSYILNVGFPNIDGGMQFEGTISNANFDMNDSATNSFIGHFDFMEGEVNGGIYELDTPSAPVNLVPSSAGAGQFTITWETATDAGSAAINLWKVQYAIAGQSWKSVDVAAGTFTKTVTGLASGTYFIRVVGANTYGNGTPSVQKTQVV